MSTATELSQACAEQGLLFLGSTDPSYPKEFERFSQWLQEKRHADLKYLENHSEVREDPSKLLEGAQSIAIVALPYFISEKREKPSIAQYARYADYHKVLRQKADRAAGRVFPPGSFRVVVDSAPVLEKALAAKTAKGFIGKNTLYIHPEHGSFLLLAEVVFTEKWIADTPSEIVLDRKTKEGGCGPCQLCQKACPTGALNRDYSLETSLCLSYWTIEQRGVIPERFWPWLAEYYFGCDLCQTACPYNLKAKGAPADWQPKEFPDLPTTACLDQASYEKYFGATPLTRAKREGLRRNALIAMAVTGHPGLQAALAAITPDDAPVLQATKDQIQAWKPDNRG